MRIAVDAMGSDHFPVPDVEGAVQAAREYGDNILLVGDEAVVRQELAKHETSGLKIDVIHAAHHITMHDKPSEVGRSKPESSVYVASKLVADGRADAFVSVGNTGAILAITLLGTLGRVPGVKRPCLSAIVSLDSRPVILLDIGANADCKPQWLLQFAVMGSIYAQSALGHKNPRLGLLSNGEEEGKGNDLIKEAGELIKKSSLNFVGNVEPKDVVHGAVDVMVSDGFVGNIFIKSLEAMGDLLFHLIRREARADMRSKAGAALLRPALRRVYKRVDPFEIGGAPLLGVNGVVIIGHGRTNALGMKNAIRQARQAVAGGIVEKIRQDINGINTEPE